MLFCSHKNWCSIIFFGLCKRTFWVSGLVTTFLVTSKTKQGKAFFPLVNGIFFLILRIFLFCGAALYLTMGVLGKPCTSDVLWCSVCCRTHCRPVVPNLFQLYALSHGMTAGNCPPPPCWWSTNQKYLLSDCSNICNAELLVISHRDTLPGP